MGEGGGRDTAPWLQRASAHLRGCVQPADSPSAAPATTIGRSSDQGRRSIRPSGHSVNDNQTIRALGE
eukprot:572864-Prymnesium_polylepis.1